MTTATTRRRKPSTPSIAELRQQAVTIREDYGYSENESKLTMAILHALAPLLNEPIDGRYIETIPPVSGKPYESTGIRSVQVQINRLNAILGEGHWRKLLHYADGGATCCAHVIVGNALAGCNLDKDGQLVIDFRAEILAHRYGWGGHAARGGNRGDLYKGAETNALKRVIAQLGPGQEVYCLDFDEDATPRAATPEPVEQPDEPQPSPEDRLEALLKADDELAGLRRDIDKGLVVLGANVEQRLHRLSGKDKRTLEGLAQRVSIAVDEREQSQMQIEGA